jgi:ferritin-like metal-binding protein YciE
MTQKIDDGKQALVSKIQALFDIENELVKALPKLAGAAHDKELKDGFTSHLEETRGHIARLEEVFKILGEKPHKLTSAGIRGILEDGQWVIDEADAPVKVKDAMLAGSARYAEHAEMAGYMSAILMSDALELTDISALLEQNLDEEKAADEKLAAAIETNATV